MCQIGSEALISELWYFILNPQTWRFYVPSTISRLNAEHNLLGKSETDAGIGMVGQSEIKKERKWQYFTGEKNTCLLE